MNRDHPASDAPEPEAVALYEEDDCEGQNSCDSESDDPATGGSQTPLWKETDRDGSAPQAS
jgi:hypothetical protein